MGKKQPELRFADYEKDWIKKRFGDEFDFLSNNTLSRDNLNYEIGQSLNVHYGDILVKLGEYLDVETEKLPYITSEEVVNKFQSSFLKDGDVVIADTAEDDTVGKCTEIVNVGEKTILAGLHTMPCRPKEEYAAKFLGYYLNSEKYHKKLLPLMQGVKVMSISKNGIQDTEIVVPDDKTEQEKISELLSWLDERICTETEKYRKIQMLKRSILEKMFPQGDKKVPEIRFSGFTEDWEQHKLIEVCDYVDYRGKTPTKTEDGIFLVTAKNVKDGYIDYESSREYISEEDYEEVMHRGLPKIGDVLITTEAPCGNVAQVNMENIALAQRIIKYRGKESIIDNTYLKHYMLAPKFQIVLSAKSSGGTVKGIKGSILHQQYIEMPSYAEQEKIGQYMEQLSNLITLHQRKVEKLKNMKAACMKKLFV